MSSYVGIASGVFDITFGVSPLMVKETFEGGVGSSRDLGPRIVLINYL